MSQDNYKPVRDVAPDYYPPITRLEAEKAVKRIYRKFGKLDSGRQLKPPYYGRARTCWISPRETQGHFKGWGRLIHDCSHLIFRRVYPFKKPHNALHVHYETQIASYVVGAGWLDGSLKPKLTPKRNIKEVRYERMVKREREWSSKQKRATNALRKVRQELKVYQRRHPAIVSLDTSA